MIYTCRFIIYISNTNININTNLVSPEYPIESDYDWTKWLETLLIKGLAEVEVGEVCRENAETGGDEMRWEEELGLVGINLKWTKQTR